MTYYVGNENSLADLLGAGNPRYFYALRRTDEGELFFAKIDQLKDKMDRDHTTVLTKLQGLEKKVWIGIGALAFASFAINNSEILSNILTTTQDNGRIERLR